MGFTFLVKVKNNVAHGYEGSYKDLNAKDVSSSYIFVNTHSSHLVQGITTLSVTAQDIFPSSEHSGTHTCLAGKMNDAMLIRTTCPVLYLVVSNIALWRL